MPIAFSQMISRQINNLLQYLFVVILFVFSFSAATELHARAVLYDGREGLNSNDIICMTKDNRGLMWIGTFNGLNIFDGYTFTRFPGLLGDRSITSLQNIAKTNELLVGTSYGLFKVDLKTLDFKKFIYQNNTKSDLSLTSTQAICLNPNDNQIYIGTRGGYILKPENNFSIKIVARLKDNKSEIKEIIAIDATHLIINNGSLILLNTADGKMQVLSYPDRVSRIQSLTKHNNRFIFCDDNLNAYASYISKIELQKALAPIEKTFHFPNKLIKTALKGDKLYCLCENYSFLIFDLKTNKIDNISEKYPSIFEGKVYRSLYVDENDVAWIGTNKGLIKVEEHSISFDKELSNIPIRISTREIYQKDNGDLFVCSYAGLWHLPYGTKKWIRYGESKEFSDNKNESDIKNYYQPLSFLYNPAGDFFYLGSDGPNLYKFNVRQKTFENLNIKFLDSGNTLSGIPDMESDKHGKIWMGTMNGLGIYDPETNTLTMQRKGPFNVGKHRVRQLVYDKANDLMYVATANGLFIFNIEKGGVKHYATNTQPALSKDNVLCVATDRQNNIWLGTEGGGINVISANGEDVNYIRRQDGLSSEIVYNMIQEDDNVFWFGTFNGLDRYEKDKNSFFNFFEEDGLSSNEFNQNSFLKTKENQFYFGSINGLTTFKPQQFSTPVPFHLYFAGISKWNDKSQSIQLYLQNLETGSTIEKAPSDQLVELHFGCSDYSDPQRNSYSYRIREISDNWISLEERHSLNIGGLPYGDFTLEVKATNLRGAPSSNILLYNLEIQQPFYRTWWFFALLLLTVCLLFYGAYLIKYQNFKRILHLRMKIASNLHDDVGSLLTRITMFSENLRYSKNNEEQRNIKLEKIAILSRNAVASMSDVLWTIDSRNDFAGNLLDRMREHAEEMLFPLGIDVNFVLSVNDLKKHISSDTRGELYLIYKEAINNIAKHSDATHVEIFYSFQDKNFHLKITNNGIREAISEISTGQGLGNMQMRAKKIGAKITIEKQGDNFIIELKN